MLTTDCIKYISKFVDIETSHNMSLTSKKMYNLFNLNKTVTNNLFKLFHDISQVPKCDINKFLKIINKCDGFISGSFVLQCLYYEQYENSDIDIFVETKYCAFYMLLLLTFYDDKLNCIIKGDLGDDIKIYEQYLLYKMGQPKRTKGKNNDVIYFNEYCKKNGKSLKIFSTKPSSCQYCSDNSENSKKFYCECAPKYDSYDNYVHKIYNMCVAMDPNLVETLKCKPCSGHVDVYGEYGNFGEGLQLRYHIYEYYGLKLQIIYTSDYTKDTTNPTRHIDHNFDFDICKNFIKVDNDNKLHVTIYDKKTVFNKTEYMMPKQFSKYGLNSRLTKYKDRGITFHVTDLSVLVFGRMGLLKSHKKLFDRYNKLLDDMSQQIGSTIGQGKYCYANYYHEFGLCGGNKCKCDQNLTLMMINQKFFSDQAKQIDFSLF